MPSQSTVASGLSTCLYTYVRAYAMSATIVFRTNWSLKGVHALFFLPPAETARQLRPRRLPVPHKCELLRWIDEARILVKPKTDKEAQEDGSCPGPSPTRSPTRAPTRAPVATECDKRDGYCTFAADCTCHWSLKKIQMKTGSGQTCYGCRAPTPAPTRATPNPTRWPTRVCHLNCKSHLCCPSTCVMITLTL